MRKSIVVALIAMLTGIVAYQPGYSADTVDSFTAQIQKVEQTVSTMQAQPVVYKPELFPTRTMPVDSGFRISGTVNGIMQNCTVSGQIMTCDTVYSKAGLTGQDDLQFARHLYIEQIFRTWLRTGDIREACPSSTQHTCTGGYLYDCTHTIVPEVHHVSRPCTAEDINAQHCPSNGMIYETQTINACHVSCEATNTTCTMPYPH